MQLLYTHANRLLVENAKNLVEIAGIDVVYKNEFAGGAAGELAPGDAWLELWLLDDARADEARAMIESSGAGPDWPCFGCGELNGPSFEFCWQCERERESS